MMFATEVESSTMVKLAGGKTRMLQSPGCVRLGFGCSEVRDSSDPLFFFSLYSTTAYHAPPPKVRTIPIMFVEVMMRLKMETAKSTVSTCLTLAGE